MKSTQDHLTIAGIEENIILLKSGGATMVLQTTAVNFDLLSELEQVSIIQSFAQLLNSLSFPIQIVIRSKRLDITAYLRLLDWARTRQTNPLLSQLMIKYHHFIQSLIKQNEVLDKNFFIIIPLSGLELGILPKKKEEALKKAQTILAPRKEQIERQLQRVGLKALQLSTRALVELFYDIYNPPQEQPLIKSETTPAQVTAAPGFKPVTPIPPQPQIVQPISPPISDFRYPTSDSRPSRTHPFVVEELADSI